MAAMSSMNWKVLVLAVLAIGGVVAGALALRPEPAVTAGGAAVATADGATAAAGPLVTVYKTPTCGCCGKWVDHMKAEGFQVEVHDLPTTTEVRREAGVPEELGSCHTATVAGYALEGHVPADAVRKLLAERPAGVAGLAVPGMPQSAPGMDIGNEPYDVLAFTREGQASVYMSK